ncbi:hypothetical protein J3R82DRAFT_4048 [Butyriboletus roseoflavus]|nr:hypothetical protein J3R82DRAFT_4048 [Butyriboletus roseoflavus]
MFLVRHRAWLTARSAFLKPVLLLSSVSVAATTFYLLSDPAEKFPLTPSRFTPTTLIEAVDVSSNTKLLTLSVPPELLPHDPGAFAPIWSIFIKDSDIQVERPYTPLEGIDENGHMKLWVKMYERGEISGGTGITPFYQLLHSVFKTSDSSFNARFTLLHGSRSSADLPPSSMIQYLVTLSRKYPDRFRLQLFAESTNDTSENHSLNIQRGRIGKSVVQDALRLTHSTPWWRRLLGLSTPTPFAPKRRILVLVCGPEGMVNVVAGPYGRNYSQGEVGGILGELGLESHQVWKL